MYKAIIIEDEYHLREALSILLSMAVPDQVQVIGYAESADEAARLIDRLQPDLVFMDILLKSGTGFDVLQQISYRKFHLIFTTAYEVYAVRAFKFSALDYLLKPIDTEELSTAINRISGLKERFFEEAQISELTHNLHKKPQRIILPTQEAMHVVKVSQIMYCETSGSYTTFFLADREKKIIVSKSLKNYESMLQPPDFFRVHQSYLINTHYMVSYSREGMIEMENGVTIPISRAKKDAFFKLMRD